MSSHPHLPQMCQILAEFSQNVLTSQMQKVHKNTFQCLKFKLALTEVVLQEHTQSPASPAHPSLAFEGECHQSNFITYFIAETVN